MGDAIFAGVRDDRPTWSPRPTPLKDAVAAMLSSASSSETCPAFAATSAPRLVSSCCSPSEDRNLANRLRVRQRCHIATVAPVEPTEEPDDKTEELEVDEAQELVVAKLLANVERHSDARDGRMAGRGDDLLDWTRRCPLSELPRVLEAEQ